MLLTAWRPQSAEGGSSGEKDFGGGVQRRLEGEGGEGEDVREWGSNQDRRAIFQPDLGAEVQALSAAFPDSLTGSQIEAKLPGLKPVPIWDAGTATGTLTHCATVPARCLYFPLVTWSVKW